MTKFFAVIAASVVFGPVAFAVGSALAHIVA